MVPKRLLQVVVPMQRVEVLWEAHKVPVWDHRCPFNGHHDFWVPRKMGFLVNSGHYGSCHLRFSVSGCGEPNQTVRHSRGPKGLRNRKGKSRMQQVAGWGWSEERKNRDSEGQWRWLSITLILSGDKRGLFQLPNDFFWDTHTQFTIYRWSCKNCWKSFSFFKAIK